MATPPRTPPTIAPVGGLDLWVAGVELDDACWSVEFVTLVLKIVVNAGSLNVTAVFGFPLLSYKLEIASGGEYAFALGS